MRVTTYLTVISSLPIKRVPSVRLSRLENGRASRRDRRAHSAKRSHSHELRIPSPRIPLGETSTKSGQKQRYATAAPIGPLRRTVARINTPCSAIQHRGARAMLVTPKSRIDKTSRTFDSAGIKIPEWKRAAQSPERRCTSVHSISHEEMAYHR